MKNNFSLQTLWDIDQRNNGIKPTLNYDDIETQEYQNDGGVLVSLLSNANPEHKLLSNLIIPERKLNTYNSSKLLFNNYTLDQTKPENNTLEENKEIEDFINLIIDTEPIKYAADIMDIQSKDELVALIFSAWFKQFNDGKGKDLSGFEHIIVGEQKGGKVNGYHFLYKYYLDDNFGLIDSDDIYYIGPVNSNNKKKSKNNYKPDSSNAFNFPEIATIGYKWNAFDYENEVHRMLIKPIGGFFNGCSIELLIALGLIRLQINTKSYIDSLNGASYDIIMYSGDNGNSLRTLYPVFKS